jgi:Ubiquitin family
MSPIDLHVIHRGVNYDLSLLPDDTLAVLYAHLETLTAVPASRQKLLYKGKKPAHTSTTTVKDAGLSHGMKVTMLGSTDQELGTMIKVENEQRRIEQIMQDRASKGTVKARLDPATTSQPIPRLTALLRCALQAWLNSTRTPFTSWNLSHIFPTLPLL